MAEITICKNENCEKKEDCYRYTAKASDFNSYAEFKPENGKCRYYQPNNEKHISNQYKEYLNKLEEWCSDDETVKSFRASLKEVQEKSEALAKRMVLAEQSLKKFTNCL